MRNLSKARTFITDLSTKPAISVVTISELLAGARSQAEEIQIRSLPQWVTLKPVDLAIAERAGQFLKHYRASHGIDDFDAVIAATAEHHGLELATLNVKHFPMFKKLKRAY